MSITTTKFIRKALYVDAVRITGANFDEIAAWCQGEVQSDEVPGKGTTKKYIKVRVHNPKNARQTKAFIGDWLLYTARGYKVYTNKAFWASFDEATADQEFPLFFIDPATGFLTEESPHEEAKALTFEELIEIVQTEIRSERHYERVEAAQKGHIDPLFPGAVRANTAAQTEQPENVETVVEQEKIEPVAAEGKRVLSITEQQELTSEEVRELVQSGEAVLAQDIAAA